MLDVFRGKAAQELSKMPYEDVLCLEIRSDRTIRSHFPIVFEYLPGHERETVSSPAALRGGAAFRILQSRTTVVMHTPPDKDMSSDTV
jgi:hypothetical protein